MRSKESRKFGYYPFLRISPALWTQLVILQNASATPYISKYCLGGFKIPPDWDVIDCGAYVGWFSLELAEAGHRGRIFSVEPSPKTFIALQKNIQEKSFERVIQAHEFAFSNVEGLLKLNLSKSGENNSALSIDSLNDDALSSEIVLAKTLSSFITEQSISPSKLFLKLEAEGFEIEILMGLNEISPAVISVDVSPERNGSSPLKEISTRLLGLGYSMKVSDDTPLSVAIFYLSDSGKLFTSL